MASPSPLYRHWSHALFDALAHVDGDGAVHRLSDPPAVKGGALCELLEVLELSELEPLSEHAQATIVLCVAKRQNVVNLHDDQALELVVVEQREHSRVQAGLPILEAAREVLFERASPMCRTIYQSVDSGHQLYDLPWNHSGQPAFGLPGVKLASWPLHKCGFEIPARAWHPMAGS